MRRRVGTKLILLSFSQFFGILVNRMTKKMVRMTRPIIRYGLISTERSYSLIASNSLAERLARPAVSSGLSFACIKFIATYIPSSEPIGLNDCARLSRRVAVSSVPIDRM